MAIRFSVWLFRPCSLHRLHPDLRLQAPPDRHHRWHRRRRHLRPHHPPLPRRPLPEAEVLRREGGRVRLLGNSGER